MQTAATADDAAFLAQWNQLGRAERSRIRRLVRLGRPLESTERARIAVAYAGFQQRRFWTRSFWLWFVPGLLMALAIATRVHPLAIGILLALSAQAVVGRYNLRRVAHVNRAALSQEPGSIPPRQRRRHSTT